MTIRSFRSGDDIAQVSVYNEAAAELPRFKPATIDEVRRRVRAPEFDPGTRLYAVEGGHVVGYATFQASGRISYPWCRKGREHWAEPLLEQVLESLKRRGQKSAWAAYRGDWLTVRDFFLARGFSQSREMLNFVLDLVEMPTPAARATTAITPVTPEDLRLLREQIPGVFRASDKELEKGLLHNPWFPSSSLFCLRSRSDSTKPAALGILVRNRAYADPSQLDGNMPCFRLGALGTEGLTHKRINGLFSFVVTEAAQTNALGVDLLGHAARLMQETDGETLAAQVSSDVPNLVRFYRQYFRSQGSFPIYERPI